MNQKPESQAKVTHIGGMTRSSVVRDYTLCPTELEDAATDRFAYGIQVGHARDNWRQGKDDPEAILNSFNHLYKHVQAIKNGKGTFADLQAAACNLAMLCWWRENGTGMAKALPHIAKETQK